MRARLFLPTAVGQKLHAFLDCEESLLILLMRAILKATRPRISREGLRVSVDEERVRLEWPLGESARAISSSEALPPPTARFRGAACVVSAVYSMLISASTHDGKIVNKRLRTARLYIKESDAGSHC